MNKTTALFGLAGTLLAGAIALDLWPTSRSAPPLPVVNTPPPPPPTPTTKGALSTVALGEVVKLQGSLSNAYVQAGQPGELFLRINLDADKTAVQGRQPMALAIVLDRSGSMAGEKIDRARESAKAIVDRLGESDQLAVISYATDYAVDLPLTPVSHANKKFIRGVIDEILDGGGTNLSGGLDAGLKQLARASQKGLVSRVVLLSDGNANQGITDPKALARIAQGARSRGITVSSLGIGVDFNEDLMTLIADSAGGSYHYARNAQAIQTALEAEFKGMAQLAARQVEVAFGLAEGVRVKQVFGYRTEMRRGQLVVPVGDMRGGEHRQIVLSLEVPAAHDGDNAITHIALAYGQADRGPREFHGDLGVLGTHDTSLLQANQRKDVLESAATVLAANDRTQAARDLESGNKTRALKTLRRRLKETKKRARKLGSRALVEQAQELESALYDFEDADVSTDSGKDLVKSEKFRAYNSFRR